MNENRTNRWREGPPGRGWGRNGLPLLLILLGARGYAQLAITEVMTSTATNRGDQVVAGGSDFWELTNFGTNVLELTDYSWNEAKATRDSAPFAGLSIRPGESIVFFRQRETTNAHAFRQWWGLPEHRQVVSWGPRTGLNSDREMVRLWAPGDVLVHSVQVGRAQPGVSFTYDPETGAFGALSVKGVGGGFQAVTADDIGSPGSTAGPVPPHVAVPPADLEVDAGQEATFGLHAAGMPPPVYQWGFAGTAIPGATEATLTLTHVQPADAGPYEVQVHNFVGPPLTRVAVLTVNTNPRPPTIVEPLVDARVYPGQTARFTVRARGYPELSYLWRSNGVVVPDSEGPTLVLSNLEATPGAVPYSVEVRNALGRAESVARLWVQPKPRLLLTELMASPSTNTVVDHADWFELTSLEPYPVCLEGWKFFDSWDALGSGLPCLVSRGVTIQPGESIVFVEEMTPEAFVRWWGAANLPPRLTVVPYAGFGLSATGDVLVLWNAAATDALDVVASEEFAAATPGVSMQFVPGETDAPDSVEGVDGAVRATESDDVGSPGYSHYAPPRFLEVAVNSGQTALTWQTVAGREYRLESRTDLEATTGWTRVGTYRATGRAITVQDPIQPGTPHRYYRVELLP